MLNWQRNADFNLALITEVEARFIADGESATRVDLEHRDRASAIGPRRSGSRSTPRVAGMV